MKSFNRRSFLKSGLAGAGGALIAGNAYGSGPVKPVKGNIITRTLGKTGLKIPVLSMGVMRADNPGLVKAALESGIVLFDTSHHYQEGRNEEMLGQVFSDYPRDRYMILTKVPPGDRDNKTGGYGPIATKEYFLERFETSLKRLKTDHVEILLHHGARSKLGVNHEPALEALQEAKKKGMARFIGFSTHSKEPEVIRAADELGFIDVIEVAYNFKQGQRKETSAAMAEAAKNGMGFVAMKNMAGGYLDKEKTKKVNPVAALKWALQDPNICTCIPGFTTFDQLETDLAILENLELSPEEERDLGLASKEMGMYCEGCTQCLNQCKKGLPVPDIMRAFMYAYGYGESRKALDTLDEHRVNADPCGECKDCTVRCSQGFPVREKIASITRLADVPSEFLS